MRLASYIVRRGGRLYIRIRVPADVRALIGRQEFKRSLATGDPQVARSRAARLTAIAFDIIDRVRTSAVLTDQDIARLTRLFYENKLDEDEALRVGAQRIPDIAASVEHDYDHRDDLIRKVKRDAALGRVPAEVSCEAENDLAVRLGGQDIGDLWTLGDKDDIENALLQLKAAYMRALVEATQRAKERDEGDWTGTPRDPLLQAPAEPDPRPAPEPHTAPPGFTPTEKSQLTPRDYVELVIAEKELKASAETKYRATMRMFEEICGTKPMHRYTEDDVVAFKDALLTVPTYHNLIPGCETATDAIAWNAAQPPHKRRTTLSARTINEGHLPFLREVFQHAKTNRHVPVAIGRDVRVARTPAQRRGEQKADARDAFSPAKLNKIFRQPLFLGARSPKRLFDPGDYLDWSWKFWLPLAMLYMGIRPQELGQLEVTDVVLRVGHPCLLIRTSSDADDVLEGEAVIDADGNKTVKSRAGTRELPVHPVLLGLGFMERVRRVENALKSQPKRSRDRNPRVFPEWPAARNRYAPAASKFFNRDDTDPKTGRRMQGFLLRAGVKTKRNALYSLRHNYKSALQNCGFEEGEQDLLMGHAGRHVSRIYQNREAYRALIKKVCELDHEGLDLTPLFEARGRNPEGTQADDPEGNVIRFARRKAS